MDITQPNWSEVDASNSAAAPDGMPEGMPPSGVNNWGRAVAGALKRWFNWTNPRLTSGSGAAYVLSYGVPPNGLVDGMSHLVQFHAPNDLNATLNINGLGALPLHLNAPTGGWSALPAGCVAAGQICRVAYHQGTGAYRIVSTSRSWLDVLTTRGDLLVRDATGYARLAVGASGNVLTSNGTDVAWTPAPAWFQTGDAKLSLRAAADAGWVLMNDGSIGSAASGATTRANADTQALYTLLWNGISNTWAPVAGGRGASAAADFAASKAMTLPRQLGRLIVGAGAGAGLTARALGETAGSETNTATVSFPHITPINGGGGVAVAPVNVDTLPFSIMPPFSAWNIMIKL